MGLLRIPFTDALPLPRVRPSTAASLGGTVMELSRFFAAGKTILLTGAGISVAVSFFPASKKSGLNDYRGPTGTYIVNKSYRPIYFSEFLDSHESRKRYWARSFLGWPNLVLSKPSPAHISISDLSDLGYLTHVITQNVDGLHFKAHPFLPTTPIHGELATTICMTCRSHTPRDRLQEAFISMNPNWAELHFALLDSVTSGQDDAAVKAAKGIRLNPDGDVDVPGLEYTNFKYPACEVCLMGGAAVEDADGAWTVMPPSPSNPNGISGGILKPGVVMFGESVDPSIKLEASNLIDQCEQLLIIGSSLATYSAFRLVKQAMELGKNIAVLNLGGVRGEDELMNTDLLKLRSAEDCQKVLPEVVKFLKST